MKITLLGTGSSVPSVTRLSSSCLVATRRGNLLIDIGPSVVRRLLETGHNLDNVDIIVVTHFHPDHTVDLATFLFGCNYGGVPRQKPLTIVGGKDIAEFLRRLSHLYPWIEPLNYSLTVKSLDSGRWVTDGLSIETAPAQHREESIAIRIEERGRSAVFTGDTDYSPPLADFALGVDLLVAECTFPERKEQGHMNLEAFLLFVAQAKPKRAVLTHLDPAWEDYRGVLPDPLLLGEDGMEIEL